MFLRFKVLGSARPPAKKTADLIEKKLQPSEVSINSISTSATNLPHTGLKAFLRFRG
jgi:hypothetical protein